MRKITSILLFAATAAALVSCNKEIEKPETLESDGIKITVVAGNPETKTTLGIDGKTVSWNNTDQVGFFNHTAGVNVESSAAAIDGKGKATFTATVPSAGTYYAYYPYQNETGDNAPSEAGVVARIPNTQSPTPTSFDPKADLLLSTSFTATGETTPADIRFKRLGAFLKIQFIDGTTGQKLSEEYATSVYVEGEQRLSAKYRIHGENGAVYQDSGYKAITATYAADTYKLTEDGKSTIIGIRPQTFTTGSKLAVTITTGKYIINKTLTFPKDVEVGPGYELPINVTITDEDVMSTSVSISRVWGLYSTSGAAWNESYGGTTDTDRNVAMDENYIYICETVNAAAPKIWAISRTNPSTVKSVSVEGIKSTPYWPVACPRVIKNTDSTINGGKDVLVVSSMSYEQTELYLYAYLDGIDNAPTPVKLGGYIGSRRLGDTFTHWGTLQKGMFFFKDFSSSRMMSYKIADTAGWDWAAVKTAYANDGTIQTLAAQGNILGPNQTGAGGYFPYPNDKNNGFFGLRSNVQAYTFNMPTDVWSASGAVDDAVSTSTGSDYFLNATCAVYFEVGAYKYVVYTRQVSNNAGGVMFLRGSYKDTYADIINARKAGGAAAAAFAIAADSTDPTAESAKSSIYSGFDLAAYQIGSDVYVAAVKQNVGLSLFKVSAE